MAASGVRLTVAICLVAALCGSVAAQKCGGRPPNVIVIMLDDLGFHDLGIQREIYGDLGSSDVRTPHINRLIKNGALFTEGYSVAGFCSPARAGFITGVHPYHVGHRVNPVRDPKDERSGLPLNFRIIPQTLKVKGYKSAMIGKWHLGVAAVHNPLNRGFDWFMGFLGSGFEYFEYARWFKGAFEYIFRQFKVFFNVTYLTDDFTQATIDFMKKNRKNPFFVFLAYNAVHSPYDYKQSDVDPWVSKERIPHVAMIRAVDRGVGRITNKLKNLGLDKCTMIVFTNDNGGHDNGANNAPLKYFKGKVWEGGVRVVISFTYPGVIKRKQRIGSPKIASLLDIYPTIESVAGIPRHLRNKKIEGLNLMPHMTRVGESRPRKNGPTQPVINRNPVKATVRSGKFKLWLDLKKGPRSEALYNLVDDIGETTDLKDKYPKKTEAMRKLFVQWDKKTVPGAFTQGARDNPVKMWWKRTPTTVKRGNTVLFQVRIQHTMGLNMDDIHWEVFKPSAIFHADYTKLRRRKDIYLIKGSSSASSVITFKQTGKFIVRVNAKKGEHLNWRDVEVKVV